LVRGSASIACPGAQWTVMTLSLPEELDVVLNETQRAVRAVELAM
jgi:hypothetical protein